MKTLFTAYPFKRLHHTLMLAFLLLSLLPLILVALFFLNAHSQDLQEQSTAHLLSVRDGKQQQINDYFEAKEAEVLGFVASELAYASGGHFYGLVNAFQRLRPNIDAARDYAQRRYYLGSGERVKTPMHKDDPNYSATERYRLLHKRYHRAYQALLARADFDDLLLVDKQGNVTYSVKKLDNFGTNLLSGPHRNARLGHTFAALKQQTQQTKGKLDPTPKVIISDFSAEDTDAPVAWLGAPIIQQGYLHSYAIFRLPNHALTRLMAPRETNAIETHLVGDDGKTRAHLTSKSQLVNNTPAIEKALAGETGVTRYQTQSGQTVLAAYTPIHAHGLKWGLVAEVPTQVAYARIHQLQQLFIVAMLLAILAVVIASHYMSNFITRPLLQLTWAAEKVSAGDLDTQIHHTRRRDEIGRLAVSFARMRHAIREKLALIRQQNQALEANITTIRAQNEELHVANKLKDEFLATTSHELRTPLHGMIGIAEALIDGANGPISRDHQYQLSIIVNSGQRLAKLVDDLLDYHKMRYGQLDLEQGPVNLNAITQLVLSLAKHLKKEKPLDIINQLSDTPIWVHADPQRLEQVMYNLLGNAIKFTDAGKIVISADTLDDRVRIQVIDTGKGIPAEQLSTVFEPLAQAVSSHYHYQHGAGLGLSISRQLVELMGGQLYVSSQPQVGTTFSFTLPSIDEPPVLTTELTAVSAQHVHQDDTRETLAHSSSDVVSQSQHNHNGLHILVVDDEPTNQQVLTSFLNIEGYQASTASDGRTAIDHIATTKPDLILLDVLMPGMSGFEVCEQLRARYDHAALPIIMLTALNQPDDRIYGFEVGANDYLCKPFDKRELAARIATHLAASQAEQRRQENQRLEQALEQSARQQASLLETQSWLISQLSLAPEAMLGMRKDGQVRFVNQAAASLFEREQDEVKRMHGQALVKAPEQANQMERYQGPLIIYIEGRPRDVDGMLLRFPAESDIDSLYVINTDAPVSQSRIQSLESAIEALSGYALGGDSRQLETLKAMGGEFEAIAEKAQHQQQDKANARRQLIVDAMVASLHYWEEATGKSKFDFAEQSGLWRVYLDRSSLQTRTLDKYLLIETLPKTPRWRTVLSSIRFILDHCDKRSTTRTQLESYYQQLRQLLLED
ncbi:response regulator [Salinivibrio sp. ES.052]|uniref:hybrid sensor histidine kinase/response regulator n=1 Tax=Salinivibrio sp. ES.052 TaxID=1882823 RepID=UPI0009413D8B|nr:response regulator [Salinivibrio sp. ES.052]